VAFSCGTGVNQLIEVNGGLSRPVMPNASLVLSSPHCNPSEISVTVSLAGYDPNQECLLDATSISRQRNICGERSSHCYFLLSSYTSLLLFLLLCTLD
jgi:hypothetical protein